MKKFWLAGLAFLATFLISEYTLAAAHCTAAHCDDPSDISTITLEMSGCQKGGTCLIETVTTDDGSPVPELQDQPIYLIEKNGRQENAWTFSNATGDTEQEISEIKITLNKCKIERAWYEIGIDGSTVTRDIDMLAGRALYAGIGKQHGSNPIDQHGHDCPDREPPATSPPNPGHTCCRSFAGQVYCFHWYCPSH